MFFPKLTQIQKGYSTIIGAIFINLVLGSFFLWGTLNLYVASYFHSLNHEFSFEKSLIIFPLLAFCQHLTAPICISISEIIGYRLHLSICLSACCAAFYFSLTYDVFIGFIFIYAIGFGLFAGLTYFVNLFNAIQYFPSRKGLVTGLISGAFGFSPLISSIFLIHFLNPENELPILDEFDHNYYFSTRICANLKNSLRSLAGFYMILGIIGISFSFKHEIEKNLIEGSSNDNDKNDNINDKIGNQNIIVVNGNKFTKLIESENVVEADNHNNNEKVEKEENLNELNQNHEKTNIEENESSQVQNIQITQENSPIPSFKITYSSVIQAVKSSMTYYLLFMLMFSITNGLFLAANFKNLGILRISDDNFLNFVGSVGAISNGSGRIIWGIIMDKWEFKKTYVFILIIQIFESFSLIFIMQYQFLYMIWVGIAFFCLGGHMVIFPAFCIKHFGTKIGPKIYGLIFWAAFLGNIIQTMITIGLKREIGFENLCFIFCAFSIISLMLIYKINSRI